MRSGSEDDLWFDRTNATSDEAIVVLLVLTIFLKYNK